MTMDLIKMHPMARKMNAHNEGLEKAIEDGEADTAREHLREIIKYAATLEEDLDFVIKKAETEVVTPQSGWQQQSPVIKFNESGRQEEHTDEESEVILWKTAALRN